MHSVSDKHLSMKSTSMHVAIQCLGPPLGYDQYTALVALDVTT